MKGLFVLLFTAVLFGQQPLNVPTVTNITPNTGTAGTVVTITGTGFQSQPDVFFGDFVATTLVYVDDTMLLVTVPSGVSGVVDVSIINGGDGYSEPSPGCAIADPTNEPPVINNVQELSNDGYTIVVTSGFTGE